MARTSGEDSFQRIASDALVLQEEIAQDIADQLRPRLPRDDKKRLRKRHTANARAYEAYLRGRFELKKQRRRQGVPRCPIPSTC